MIEKISWREFGCLLLATIILACFWWIYSNTHWLSVLRETKMLYDGVSCMANYADTWISFPFQGPLTQYQSLLLTVSLLELLESKYGYSCPGQCHV